MNQTSPPLPEPEQQSTLYLNRDLSWLRFNERVLQQALDGQHPLLERLKFLAIFSSNLDEFMMVRYAALRKQAAAGNTSVTPDGRTASELAGEIRNLVHELVPRHRQVLREEVLPQLARAGLQIIPEAALRGADRQFSAAFFAQEIFPLLTPVAVPAAGPFPHVVNLAFSLFVTLHDSAADSTVEQQALVRIPASLPRFVSLPGTELRFVLVEELIAAHLPRLFPGYRVRCSHGFRVTRDAGFEIGEAQASDLPGIIAAGVKRRRWAAAVRLEVDAATPASLTSQLQQALGLDEDEVYRPSSHLDVAAFSELAALPLPTLRDEPLQQELPEAFRAGGSFLAAIRQGDILLHHPFHSFGTVVGLLREAADDPQVVALKQTIYRVGRDSPVVDALIRAARNGKQVTVLVELQARFDEENNLGWARELELAGAHVIYGVDRLKTHAKLLLIVRREQEAGAAVLRRYVHLGTGNYHPLTSQVYTDLGLLTCADAIGADVADLFNQLTGLSKQSRWRHLWVAPLTLRRELEAAIAFEQAEATAGRPALIQAKLNSLVDPEVIRQLYAASRAGARIELIIRGSCCLRPGVPGLSDNITVRSIVGRFLEHSRVLRFHRAGREMLLLGSADFMPRNLDHRVETLVPVTSATLKSDLLDLLQLWLSDTVRARQLLPDGTYQPVASNGEPVDSQLLAAGIAFRSGSAAEVQACSGPGPDGPEGA